MSELKGCEEHKRTGMRLTGSRVCRWQGGTEVQVKVKYSETEI